MSVSTKIYGFTKKETSSSVSFSNIRLGGKTGQAVLFEFFLYDKDGHQIGYEWESWRFVTDAQNVLETEVYDGYAPYTIFSYKMKYSYRDTGAVIDTASGQIATSIPEFDWDAPKVKGQKINITANEWNRLLDTCAKEIEFVGNGVLIPEYVKGASDSEDPDIISANIYNYVIDIFANRLGYKEKLKYVQSGVTPITAESINLLKTAMNQTIRTYSYLEQPPPDPID